MRVHEQSKPGTEATRSGWDTSLYRFFPLAVRGATDSRALGGGGCVSTAMIFGRWVLPDADRWLMLQLAGTGQAVSLSLDVSHHFLRKATCADVWSLLSGSRKGRKPWWSGVALCNPMSSNGQWRRDGHVLLKWIIHSHSSNRVNRLSEAERNSLIAAMPDIRACFPLCSLLSCILNCICLLWASTFIVCAC